MWPLVAWVAVALAIMNIYIWATYDRDVALIALGVSLSLNFGAMTWKLATLADREIAHHKDRQ